MKKRRFFGFAAAALLTFAFVGGCRCCRETAPGSADPKLFTEARRRITAGEAECVLVTADGRLVADRGRGVSPLLNLYDTHRAEMKDATVVDKVIGRAAASIAILGGAKRVHGEVMSEDAAAYLKANGVAASHTLLVPRILNAKRNGLCPLERSVEGIDDPAAAVAALRRRIAELQRGAALRKP